MSDDRKNQGDAIEIASMSMRSTICATGRIHSESPRRVEEAVRAVGDRVDAVKQHLARGKERGIEGRRDGRY